MAFSLTVPARLRRSPAPPCATSESWSESAPERSCPSSCELGSHPASAHERRNLSPALIEFCSRESLPLGPRGIEEALLGWDTERLKDVALRAAHPLSDRAQILARKPRRDGGPEFV